LWPLGVVAAALLAAGVTWFVARPPAEEAVTKRFSIVLPEGDRLPFAAGTMLAVSPDGGTLAYRAARGSIRLFVRRIDQFDATMIGEASSANEAQFFSDDGKWIVYPVNNALKKVAVTGGPSETIASLTDIPRSGDWSSDGTIVLAGNTLSTVPAAGGSLTALVKAPVGRRFWYPQFVAGGRAIIYTSSAPGPDLGDIEVFDIAARTSRKLFSGVASRLLPTGHLVFIRGGSLWAVRFDEKTLQVQGSPVPVVEGIRVENGGAVQYSVGRDGTLAYIAGSSTGVSQMVWIGRDGKEEPVGVPPRGFYLLRLDPTGRRAAIEVHDGRSDIWMLPIGRQTATRVTFDTVDSIQPAWTPDGRLVFASERDKTAGLFWQAADGTGNAQRIVSHPTTIDQPSVTPDGKSIVARSEDDIVLVDFSGKGGVKKLIEGAYRDRNPMVSHNGRWIAYQSDESGLVEVYVRPFPDVGKGKWQVSEQGGSRPLWAHNGKEMFYLAYDQTLMSVTFTETGGAFVPSAPRKVVLLPQQGGGAARPFDVSLDDQRFLTMKNEANDVRAEINVVLNWFEELKKKVP
jgi:serine/threonine-protein kinase